MSAAAVPPRWLAAPAQALRAGRAGERGEERERRESVSGVCVTAPPEPEPPAVPQSMLALDARCASRYTGYASGNTVYLVYAQ